MEDSPTILERYFFVDSASSSKHFLQAILAPYKRR